MSASNWRPRSTNTSLSTHAWVTFQFGQSPSPPNAPASPHFAIQQNVTDFVCLNLDEVFSNEERITSPSNSTLDSPLFTLNGVQYTRSAEWNGGDSSGENFNASAEYNLWYVAQGYAGLRTDLQEPDSGVSAAMQLNVYGERDCGNETTPWIGYSCQNELAVPGGAAWGARSVSLQPHDVNAAECLYNATNGVETSGTAQLRTAWSESRIILAVVAMAMVAAFGL